MLGLGDLKQTRAYQEAEQAGEEKTITKMVPKLLKRGMTIKQIAEDLELPVETIQRLASQE